MTEMVEPDRTIMIVSIIGLVVIWGSFFYHRYLQNGETQQPPPAESGGGEIGGSAGATADSPQKEGRDGGDPSRPGKGRSRPGKKRRK